MNTCKTCKTCKFWGEAHFPFSKTRMAKCSKLGSIANDNLYDCGYETEQIVTGQDFGCIHYEQKESKE